MAGKSSTHTALQGPFAHKHEEHHTLDLAGLRFGTQRTVEIGTADAKYPQSTCGNPSVHIRLISFIFVVYRRRIKGVIRTAENVGKQMPGPDRNLTGKTRPGLLLNVAVVAWLSIMVMPCAVFAIGSPIEVTEAPVAVQVDCHGTHEVAGTSEPECCFDSLAITGGEVPKSQRVDVVAAVLAAPLPMPTVAHFTSSERIRPPPQSDAHQPVYLTTQRLRI